MVVSGAITDDRNANSATKSDVTRLRRERHTVPRAIERNAAQSPDPNNIHQQDIWSSRGSGASVASPRIFRDVCELVVSLRGSVIVSARMRRRALGEKRNSDGNYSSSEVFVASGWQKSPRRNALTEIALSRQCRDLLTDNSVELIVPSWGMSQEPAGHGGHGFSLERRCNSQNGIIHAAIQVPFSGSEVLGAMKARKIQISISTVTLLRGIVVGDAVSFGILRECSSYALVLVDLATRDILAKLPSFHSIGGIRGSCISMDSWLLESSAIKTNDLLDR
ncbi:hypothetical protein EAG_03025 [Camponotus floridanus]|uniref:Uncharacterized protein n=1 Tax=Camponotus floridanus TaxID=104421 RepID=E2ARM1_CAMFO|nr:hypothetical protein EAG_03025 [Camponotus floridanus]